MIIRQPLKVLSENNRSKKLTFKNPVYETPLQELFYNKTADIKPANLRKYEILTGFYQEFDLEI